LSYLQSGVRHILLTKADSCSRRVFFHAYRKSIFLIIMFSFTHRAGFILSLAHIGIRFLFLIAILFSMSLFIVGMSVVLVGDGESQDNLRLFDGEQYLTALFSADDSDS
jgi:hypothetical protein